MKARLIKAHRKMQRNQENWDDKTAYIRLLWQFSSRIKVWLYTYELVKVPGTSTLFQTSTQVGVYVWNNNFFVYQDDKWHLVHPCRVGMVFPDKGHEEPVYFLPKDLV